MAEYFNGRRPGTDHNAKRISWKTGKSDLASKKDLKSWRNLDRGPDGNSGPQFQKNNFLFSHKTSTFSTQRNGHEPVKILQTKFYYLRDPKNRPVVTVCLMQAANAHYQEPWLARGIAICSPNDNPCKKTGRALARKRALAALHRGANHFASSTCPASYLGEMVHRKEAKAVRMSVRKPFFYKSIFNPDLTRREQRLLRPANVEINVVVIHQTGVPPGPGSLVDCMDGNLLGRRL